MRHRRVLIGAALLLVCAVVAVLCAGALAPGGADSAEAAGSVALTVQHNGTLIKQYTLADLQALAVYNGYAGIHNSAGTITGPDPITGVKVSDVLRDALGGTGITTLQSVDITAPDQFGISPSGGEVIDPAVSQTTNWVMFDASSSQQIASVAGHLACVLAWARGGSSLDSSEGPLRFYVADDTLADNAVMTGSDSVQRVSTLNVTDGVVEPWTLALVGLKSHGVRPTDVVNMQSYQTCAAPGCHGAGWKAPDGKRWTGVALYMLIGQVDGGKDMTYNAALARKGYRIRLYSSSGKTVTLSSRITVRKSSIVVANRAGGSLVAKYYPLRLVGPTKYVPASKRLGQIVKIKMLPW